MTMFALPRLCLSQGRGNKGEGQREVYCAYTGSCCRRRQRRAGLLCARESKGKFKSVSSDVLGVICGARGARMGMMTVEEVVTLAVGGKVVGKGRTMGQMRMRPSSGMMMFSTMGR